MKSILLFLLAWGVLKGYADDLAPVCLTNSPSTNAIAPAAKPGDMVAFFRMHWDDRVRAFKEQNQIWQNVVLLGDSITEGFDAGKYFPGRRVLNRGIGADVIGNDLPADDHRGILRRLDSSVFNCAPTDVFLLIGINDFGDGHSVDELEQGYREILERIHTNAPLVKIHVESVLPTRGKYAKHNAHVREFNVRLRKLAAEFGCDYLDLHQLMVDDHGELKAEFTPEGLHLNERAYQVWQAAVNKTMGWQ
jgi:lysophospholipase L1-like esterase